MGRLFQYNRFDAADNPNNKRNNQSKPNSIMANVQPTDMRSPAYIGIYAEYSTSDAETESPAIVHATGVDSAIRKCQQWSHKLLATTTAATTTALANAEQQSNCSSNNGSTGTAGSTGSSHARSHTSDYHSRQGSSTQATTVSRTQKAYGCMKDFLRRKLFQQHELKHEMLQNEPRVGQKSTRPAYATSDYEEQDMLDSSYNADEEYDEQAEATDCSCDCSNSSDMDIDDDIVRQAETQTSSLALRPPTPGATGTTKSGSPRKSLLSLNCWQSSNHSDTSSCSETESASSDEEHQEPSELDSDAGISDCRQLVGPSERRSISKARPRRPQRKAQRQQERFNTDNDEAEEEELLTHDWYQPMIASKAALEHLQHATPGSFIVRRRSASSLELCLRSERKVKQYTVQCTPQQTYKLKGARKHFNTLKALVTHHSVMPEQLPLTLDLPRAPEKKDAIRYSDDFEPLESLQLLGILKSLQAKHIEW